MNPSLVKVYVVSVTRMSERTLVHEIRGVFESREEANGYATQIHREHPNVMSSVNAYAIVYAK
jgi:hypothetical protein